MNVPKDLLVEAVRQRAEEEAKRLAGEFARAASAEREAILAEMQYEQWLAETAELALAPWPLDQE